jgi:endonuclease/exonuclease/phosphatase (EEP) superfamily protein YafD
MSEPSPRPRLRWLRLLLTAGVFLVLVLGAIGQLVRDREAWLGYLCYAPLLLVGGVAAVLLDLLLLGRCLRPRFGLTILGLLTAGWATWTLLGTGSATVTQSGPRAGLVQWNVHWGGGKTRSPETWAAIKGEIHARSPDVIVLAEAPEESKGWIKELLPEGWQSVQCEHPPESPYWYRLVVCAAAPVKMEYHRPITHGHVMAVTVSVQGRSLRLLVVDGESDPGKSRVAMLEDVTALCREAQQHGEPFDLLAGDFNTPAHSLGFDALEADGYRLASRSAVGWRGTWPANFPLLDIDHVWLHGRLPIHYSEVFTNAASDHRGQFVQFYLPEQAKAAP